MPVPRRFLTWWAIAGLAIGGCEGTRVTRENCDKIRVGMPRSEVERLLGPPSQSYQGIVTWRGKRPEERIVIVFDDERRVSEKTCEGLAGR
jgi:hypothetical protein